MDLLELKDLIKQGKSFNFTFFWGHQVTKGIITDSCFSQWYPCKFKDENNIIYNSTEQYMMAQKAILFNDDITFKEIMKETNPAKIKKLGRKVKNFDNLVWNKECQKIVEKGNYFKFSQNEELKKHLLSTENNIIAEASPYDAIWGIKMRKDDIGVDNPFNWKGTNYLGFALMSVRERLKTD